MFDGENGQPWYNFCKVVANFDNWNKQCWWISLWGQNLLSVSQEYKRRKFVISRDLVFSMSQHPCFLLRCNTDMNYSGPFPNTNDSVKDAYNHKKLFIKCHDDVIKWKHIPRYWPFVRGIHRINGWANNREAGDLRRHHARYDVTVMAIFLISNHNWAMGFGLHEGGLTLIPARISNCIHDKV